MPRMKHAALALLALASCGDNAVAPTPDAAPPYSVAIFDHAHVSSHGDQPDFQKIHASVDLGAASVAKATLVVDLASPCFPFSNWTTDRPPSGQSWPADCDAFDRNFEFTLDEPASATAPPALELARMITPFGGPLHEEIDVTDLVNVRHGVHDVQAYIATWSDSAGKVSGSNGSWFVSAHLDLVPGPAPHDVLAIIPLFNGAITTAAPLAPIDVQIPDGVATARLEYRVTGHGGADDTGPDCIGPAEEFCKRTHHVTVDGVELEAGLQPWRTDCAQLCTVATYQFAGGSPFSYCTQNPCGAIQSVQAPRANWCPGSATPPMTWDPAALHVAGHHTFGAAIDGENAGGTWRVSAALYLFGS
jgi:hypothetical protein